MELLPKQKRDRFVTPGRLKVRKRGSFWQADARFAGLRHRIQGKTKDEAERLGRKWLQDRAVNGFDPSLNPAQARDALRALSLLPRGVSLESAARFYRDNLYSGKAINMKDALALWIQEKEKGVEGDRPLRPKTILGYKHFRGIFEDVFPTEVAAVTSSALKEWFALHDWKPETYRHYRACCSAFFGWCVAKEFCADNPLLKVKKGKGDSEAEPSILTSKQAQSLLSYAEAHSPKIVPYLAISLFAGIRHAELRRLTAESFKDGQIEVKAGASKTRRRRLVDIRPNLAAWIRSYPPGTAVYFDRYPFRTVTRNTGLHPWKLDTLRHTFVSMLYALTDNETLTAAQAGNSTAVLQKHYRALVSKMEAEKFWNIVPTEKVPATRGTSKGD